MAAGRWRRAPGVKSAAGLPAEWMAPLATATHRWEAAFAPVLSLRHRRTQKRLHMLRKVKFAACLYLQEISSLGQAVAFFNRGISADGQQRLLFIPASSFVVGAVSAHVADGLAERDVSGLVGFDQPLQATGRLLFRWRRLCDGGSRHNGRRDNGATGLKQQGAAIDPGRDTISSSGGRTMARRAPSAP